MAEEVTAVMFRKFRDGEIIALFPYLPAEVGEPGKCTSFVHMGQHGAAHPAYVIGTTKPANPGEYAALRRELESAPYHYRLRVIFRTPPDAYQRRAEALRRP
jgi:hypothetical protein